MQYVLYLDGYKYDEVSLKQQGDSAAGGGLFGQGEPLTT